MADNVVQPSAALKTMEREYKSKAVEMTALFENLLKLLSEKEVECEDLKYDLQDQTESRRHWHKRAADAEGRIASVQHVLVLVDGNQTFFKPGLILAGPRGVRGAVETLIAEAKTCARAQHKNDLSDNLSAIVHIFVDVGRLAHDLSTANLLPEPDQLWTFIQDASKLEPGITISDCGSGQGAVDAKMKHFYELYLENCHCRHLFLALGREADYYNVLSTYADDEFTRLKTSLIKPSLGLPDKYILPFDTVDFSCLESVRRQTISFNDTVPKVNGMPAAVSRSAFAQVPSVSPFDGNARAAPRASLTATVPESIATPPAGPRGPVARVDVYGATPRVNGTPPATSGRPASPYAQSPAPGSSSSPIGQAAPSTFDPGPPSTMVQAPEEALTTRHASPAFVAQTSSAPATVQTQAPVSEDAIKEYGDANGNVDKVEDVSSAAVVKLNTSSHSSSQSKKSAEQSWESATVNDYAPAPNPVPWTMEEPMAQPASHEFNEPQTYSRKNNNNFPRRQPREGAGGGGGGGSGGGGGGRQDRFNGGQQSGRRLPRQFKGSYDDMMSTQGSSASPRPATTSMSSLAMSKSTDFANSFTRQDVTKPEPNPQARPVLAPVALNTLNQRIDLKLPRPAPADEEAFKLRTNNRHLCNEHHMRGQCSNINCTYDHEEISDGVYLALRNTARLSPCNQGSRCRQHDCYLGHHCPNVSRISACGRPNCPFKARNLHDIFDLTIVEMIEPSKKEELPVEDLI
ncbi:hypothetical protein A1O7_08006 [Cladophialophora yegresii CBS 114405]|uniref:C3H1-type domain-containing protein n=1 Tax=Cladophialophora yegresii CBS 114405 TaxID=1182544 RepID=W9VSC7_9EURO|nr:uncharacterized protein A1O7_08006 [Cladophialophora yegresii CBS 114405]EXJ55081.1 hypothetical protein A1O7_08006 [Cladophialophora yegresii CBS 114405]